MTWTMLLIVATCIAVGIIMRCKFNPWHLAAYATTDAGASTNVDLPAPADPTFQRRNSHLLFSEPWNVVSAFALGATLTRVRFSNASMIADSYPHLWPIEASATVPDLPQVQDYRDNPIALPMNEEITMDYTSTAVGGDQKTVLLWMAPDVFNLNVPNDSNPITLRFTAVVAAGSENTWGADTAIVMEKDPRAGVYAVVGCYLVAPNAIAFRMIFPTTPSYLGRKFRPGGLVQNALGDSPCPWQRFGYGEWGRFYTLEYPSIQVLSDAAGGTYEGRLVVVKLGDSKDLLYQ